MRLILLCISLALLGCGTADQRQAQTLPRKTVIYQDPVQSGPSPLVGLWIRQDGRARLDLSELELLEGEQHGETARVLFRAPDTDGCTVTLTLTGDDQAGDLSVSDSVAALYSTQQMIDRCRALEGAYQYQRQTDGRLFLCGAGACSFWAME